MPFFLLLAVWGWSVIAQTPEIDSSKDNATVDPALPRASSPGQEDRDNALPAVPREGNKTSEAAMELLPYFRIGFLQPTEGSAMDQEWYRGLRQALLNDNVFQEEMKRLGIQNVVLRTCDSSEDMLQRLGLREFDLVYAPSMVYGLHRLSNPGEYRVILMHQERFPRKGSIREYPRHRGVLFMRRDSAIEQAVRLHNKRRISDALNDPNTIFAVSGIYDAAGYLYGMKLVDKEFQEAEPELIYSGSPQEVVKAVICGLASIGACQEEVLDEVLQSIPAEAVRKGTEFSSNDFVYVYDKRTSWIPTDPVLLRSAFSEDGKGRVLGERVREVLPRYHRLQSEEVPLLVPGKDEYFDNFVKDILSVRRGAQ